MPTVDVKALQADLVSVRLKVKFVLFNDATGTH